MFGYDLGIDLGTTSLVISIPGKGVVLNEPSYIAYDIDTEKMLYAGRRAYHLEGREPNGVHVTQPLRDGVISSYNLTEQMLRHFLQRSIRKSIFKPRVVAGIPSITTDVEKRTLISVLISAGARSVCLIEEPLAAAFGCGIDPLQPTGVFVIDIGGGTTNMAVVSQGSMTQTETVKIAGTDFDEAILKHIRNQRGVQIGIRTAEEIKKTVGSAYPRENEVTTTAKGRDVLTGLPKTIDVTSTEIYECLKPLLDELSEAAVTMFERTGAQLVADITDSGVLLTGGSAELYGMDKMFSEAMGVDAMVAPQPNLCVSKGATVALNRMNVLDNYGYRFKTKENVRIR